MPGGSEVVGDDQRRILSPTNGDRCFSERNPGTGKGALRDDENMCGPALLATTAKKSRAALHRRGCARGASTYSPWGCDDSAGTRPDEQITPHDPHDCEYEDPQQDEETEARDGEDEIWQGG